MSIPRIYEFYIRLDSSYPLAGISFHDRILKPTPSGNWKIQETDPERSTAE